MRYGMPYMGSKSQLAREIIEVLPKAGTLVDMFGGGGAISHCALLSNKWDKIIYNELESMVANAFQDAVNGKFANENRWISREDFFKLRNTDFYVGYCFSFGNNPLKSYSYSVETEQWKKALHYARVFNDFSLFKEFGIDTDGSKPDIIAHFDEYRMKYIDWYKKNVSSQETNGLRRLENGQYSLKSFHALDNLQRLERLRRLDRLQSSERLNRLQDLEGLTGLEIYNLSYENVEVPDDTVVYCDIPYNNTQGYISTGFNHEQFYEWALTRKFPVYISEYNMPDDFEIVWEREHRSTLSSTSNNKKTLERIYWNKVKL